MKLIQHSDDRSEQDVDDEHSRMEWDLLAREESLESVREEKEKLQRIRTKINVLEEKLGGMKEEEPSLRTALKTIFSWRNYSVYLITSWTFTAFSYMGLFYNLYLLELGWGYVLIGTVLSLMSAISATSRLIGGYVGDVSNRKHLSVIAMAMMAAYNLIMGIFVEFTWIIIALLFFSTMDVFKGGSTAYIMDNIPRKHSGLGISLFTAGRVFGIITLGVFVVLTQTMTFDSSLRLMFLIGGLFLVVTTIMRAILLEGKAPETQREGVSLARAFILENRKAAAILFRAVPGMIAIVVLDSLSDSLFKFGAYIYIYDDLGIQIPGLILMSMITIMVSVPLLLGTGMLSDRRGERNTAFIIYSIMPICALLLVIAPWYTYWVPLSVVNQADSVFNGLGAVFSTPFLALVIKSVNDSLWYLLLLTIIQKNLPRRDTSKILSVFWFIVYMFSSIGPTIGGIVFDIFEQGYQLFIIVLLLNLIILGWIATKGLVRTTEEKDSIKDNGEMKT
ncbi:MAG: MFS transporter [Candidatus Thorarchaeota archaeon]